MQIIFVFLFCLASINASYGQKPKKIDEKINENKGTLVIREIKKTNVLTKNEALLIVRVFQPFHKLQMGNAHSLITVKLDNLIYALPENGILNIKTLKGRHIFSVISSSEPLFSSFHQRIVKLNKKTSYQIDIYLPSSFIPYRH